MRLTDRQRVELVLPSRLMYSVVSSAGANPQDPDYAAITKDLVLACVEPLDGMMADAKHKVIRRIERTSRELCAPYIGAAEVSVAKMGMILFYFMQTLIELGILELYEGTPMARATTLFLPFLTEYFDKPALDHSAQKQGRRMVDHCQRLGFYL
jgi:hypothetical protein